VTEGVYSKTRRFVHDGKQPALLHHEKNHNVSLKMPRIEPSQNWNRLRTEHRQNWDCFAV
jgi:hypothetical protein